VQKRQLQAELEGRRKEAMKVSREKKPAKLRMQELRDLNQVELTQDDIDRRLDASNAPTKVTCKLGCPEK
jgi:hypothetical protein